YGGTGADHFVFNSIADSPGGGADKIMDFSHAEGDVIDLSGIDAITGGADDAFTLISGGFTHHAGELIVVSAGLNTYSVRGDVNGDGVADFFITVHSTTALVAGDFIL
ncbi:MAG: M10 family metallopeptidase C-terminal domain-containing protein, partial [Rhizomicrobium sp.]